jgi:DNA-directed RNA polymerase subunit RPC12/RpoP
MMVLYKCNLCDNEIKKLYQDKAMQAPYLVCECGGVLEKCLPNFDTSSVEVVDTGAMSRKVELRKDAAKRFKEKGDIYIKNTQDRERILKKNED